jgi:hypothetical protein
MNFNMILIFYVTKWFCESLSCEKWHPVGMYVVYQHSEGTYGLHPLPQDRNNTFHWKSGNHMQHHIVTTQTIKIHTFTAVKTYNFVKTKG